MSNPNDVTVYSPEGEPFEMSRANARDLVSHAGWAYSRPTIIERIVEVPAADQTPAAEEQQEEEAPAEDEANAAGEGSDEATDEGAADEAEADEGTEGEEADEEEVTEEEEAPALRTTVEAFADLTTREEVVAYLAEHFPDFKPHHLSQRDGLVKKAVELATA